jgi:hypothetical protein
MLGRGKTHTPYDLAHVQADVARLGAAAFTKTALDGGRTMGLRARFHVPADLLIPPPTKAPGSRSTKRAAA